MSVDNPGGKRWWRGGYACECMVLAIEDVVEPRLRAAGKLDPFEEVRVFQYAYNDTVSASAGTHGGGGALDHDKGDDTETKIWRESGVADWQRGDPHDQAFDDHNHGIWQGCPHTSSDADGQLVQYEAGCNGLADWGPDQSPTVPPISWQDAYRAYMAQTEEEGLFGMTSRISKYRGTPQTVRTDDWTTAVAVDNDGGASIAAGPSKGMCDVIVYVTGGLQRDQEIGLRWGHVKVKDGEDDVITWQSSAIDVRSNGGTDRHQLVCHFDLPADADGWEHRLRLFVSTAGQPVTLGTIETKGWEDKS